MNFKKEQDKVYKNKIKELSKRFENIKKLVITGSGGFLGSHLLNYAMEKDYQIVAGIHSQASF